MNEDFTLRLAGKQDIDGIFYVMEQVKDTIANQEWFVADDRDYIRRHIDGNAGFTMVAETKDGRIAAFFAIDYPGTRADNLGYDIGLPAAECLRTAHMDTVGVLPEYRGNHLMARLLELAETVLSKTGYRHLMCTIHPDNRYSLDNMKAHGYEIMATKEKYGGFMRHTLYKQTAGSLMAEGHKRMAAEGHEGTAAENHEGMAAEGYEGTAAKGYEGTVAGYGKADSGKPVILVSACLLGVHCRYNGKGGLDEAVKALMEQAVLIPVCPEVMGGLATPRDPAERVGSRVVTIAGGDVTSAYRKGAGETLRLAQLYGCQAVILKERSPSCGSGLIYDGTHSGTLTDGDGLTAELLKKNGIRVFGESKIEDLERFYGI